MVNYLYSELQRAIEKVRYEGLASQTAAVIINQDDNTIQVNVTQIPVELLEPHIDKGQADGKHLLVGVLSNGIVNYSWVNIEDFLASLEHQNEELNERITQEATRTDNMINQLNENVNQSIADLNNNLVQAINTINGGIEAERQTRSEADSQLQLNIDKEEAARKSAITAEETRTNNMIDQLNQNVSGQLSQLNQNLVDAINTINGGIAEEVSTRKQVDQHLWDILPDNIIAGTPMQGLENANAVNIVFSKYQKHGIGEDPAEGEFVEVPNQAITLFPATQEVAGVLTAADKTKIDNIATDIETAVQAEAEARQEADTQLGNRITAIEDTGVLNSELTGNGKLAINVQSEAGRTFNIEAVDTSDADNDDRFTLTLDNNDSISGKKLDNTSVPLVFMSKWDKVEVGGSSAPLNLNSNDGTVTVNDTYTLLNNKDRDNLNDAIEAEETRATQAEANLQEAIDAEITRAEAKETELDTAIQSEVTARSTADTQIHEELDAIDTRVGNLEGKTTRLFYGDGTADEPTADGINTFVTTLPVEPPYAAPFEGIAVVVHRTDENTYRIWHYYSNTGEWQDDGVDTVSTFTNSIRGIIQGSTNDGYVAAENGLGKVSGWETVKSDIKGLQTEKLNLSDIPNTYSGNSEQFPMTQKATNDAIAYTLREAQKAWEKDDDTINSALEAHEGDFENPHQVTKAQVGLEFVENLAPEDLPISTATQEALDAKAPTNHSSLSTEYGVGDATHYGHVKVDAIPGSASTNAVSSMGVYSALSNKVDKVEGKELSSNDFTDELLNKLNGIEEGAEKNTVTKVAGKTGEVTLVKDDVGLSNVANELQYSASNPQPITYATLQLTQGGETLGSFTAGPSGTTVIDIPDVHDLPLVTASDNGKFLSVQDGQYTLTTLSFNINDNGELILTYSY